MKLPGNNPEAKTNSSRLKKRVLLIGGAGFVGSALLPMMLSAGYQVRVLDLLIYGIEPIEAWLRHPGLELIRGDFRNADTVSVAMEEVDDVVHLGAIVGDPACDLDERIASEVNWLGTISVAEIAKRHRIDRFIFASTCSVYGANDQILSESSDVKPVTLYAHTKAASEKALMEMSDKAFSPVILRFSTVYGLSGRFRFDLVVNLLTAKAMVDREITIFGGNQWRAFVHVQDVAHAIMDVLRCKKDFLCGEILNVGSNDQNYTLAQIGEIIHHQVPAAKIITIDDRIDPQNYKVNFDKIQRVLNFSPRWTIEQGIQQVIEVINNGQVTDYKDARYSNVKFLSRNGLEVFDKIDNLNQR
jgi:nucleoside-diphosphate-sugar epimerase